jgi:methylmalonyl-CoA mutase cobalamin-binding subunit
MNGTRKQTQQKIQINAAAIQERVTPVLRSIPKEAFAESFQKLYERCQQCVAKDGYYFEGQ